MSAYLKRLAAGVILLFFGLYAGVFSLVGPFSLDVEPVFLLGACLLTALLAGAVFALPGRRAYSWCLLALCGLLLLLLWRDWDRVIAGGQVVVHKITYGYHRALPALNYYVLPPSLEQSLPSYLREVSTEFLGLLALLAALWIGIWLLRGCLAFPAAAMVCAGPGLGLFILRQPDGSCLAALLFFLALVILCRRGYREDPELGARRVLWAAVPLTLLMALLLGVFPAGDYRRDPRMEMLRKRLQQMPVALSGLDLRTGGQSSPGVQRLDRLSPPRFSGRTVLTVQTDYKGSRLLLRGYSAGRYTSWGWEPLPGDALGQAPDLSGGGPCLYPAQAAQAGGVAGRKAITVIDQSSGGDYYYLPYFPATLPQAGRWEDDSYLARPAEVDGYVFYFLPQEEAPAGAALAQGQADDYQAWVYEHYLDMPYALLSDEALGIIRAAGTRTTKAKWTDQRTQRVAQAQAVARYLASFTRYDQSVPAAPEGEDLTSYFLTESHRGFCVHYATAATLMLREMGIPARFAAGYVVSLPGDGTVVEVPDHNAHAWVEVYVDGFGWQPVDVTPGSYMETARANPSQTPAPTSEPSAQPSPTAPPLPSAAPSPTATPSLPPAPTQGPDGPGGALTQAGPPVVPILGLSAGGVLLGLGLFLLLRRRLRLRALRRRCRQSDPNAAAVELYRYLAAVEAHLGYPVPPEAKALAQKAAFSPHVLTGDEQAAMQTYARQGWAALRSAPPGRRLALRYVWCLC